jgi:hypothetical protein
VKIAQDAQMCWKNKLISEQTIRCKEMITIKKKMECAMTSTIKSGRTLVSNKTLQDKRLQLN